MVMFVGSSIQIDLLNEMFFVSLTRDAQTGSLDLESLPTMFPVKLRTIYANMISQVSSPPTCRRMAVCRVQTLTIATVLAVNRGGCSQHLPLLTIPHGEDDSMTLTLNLDSLSRVIDWRSI